MSRFAFLALVAVLACFVPRQAAAQITLRPSYRVHEPVEVTLQGTPDVSLWRLPAGVAAISQDDGRRIFIWAAAGRYSLSVTCISVDWDGHKISALEYATTLVIEPVGPTPEPTPNPPQPEPPPVVSGKRTILLVYETGETTPQLSGMITQLRDGQAATWLANRGHALWCLDDDSKTPEGLPLPLLQPYRERNPPLPALLILDAAGAVLYAGSVPATPAAVVELLKMHGG